MNATSAHDEARFPEGEPFFCLRAKDSDRFWDGRQWAPSADAKRFHSLDHAFAAGLELRAHVDLLVMFPTRTGRLVIPIGKFSQQP